MTRLAVLIDAENIDASFAPQLLQCVRKQGDLNIVRVCGDFSNNRLVDWLEVSREHGFEPLFQLGGGRKKNSTDISLTIEAMDILHSGVVDAFCIASDDRDFFPLVKRLRGQGKRVYLICKSVAPPLRAICSGVLELEPRVVDPPIVRAFKVVAGDAKELTLSRVGELLRRHAPELVPPGKGKLRKRLQESGCFEEVGVGPAMRVRLRA